ncbi:MAG: monovalent cation/H(+) antiporter subunit G [Rickettsiaceae bacterium]|nr:monovalent cation/H(+) antiporter subunit G [Rickettsiaceae bacterium]
MFLIAWLLIFSGLFFIFTALIGSIRMPSFYTKIHAIGVSDSFGVPLTLLGISLLQENVSYSMKIILMIILILMLSPLSTNLMSKAYMISKSKDSNHVENIISDDE